MYELSSLELSSSISRKLFIWFDDLVSFPKQGDFLLMYVLVCAQSENELSTSISRKFADLVY